MNGAAVAPARNLLAIRYSDHGSLAWIYSGSPCRWRDKIEIQFQYVPFMSLQIAPSGKHPDVVRAYERRIRSGKTIAPPVVSANDGGTFYVHDGNHRCEAIRNVAGSTDANVRVATVTPKSGYLFRWRWFRAYGTYSLEPEHMCCYRPVNRRGLARAPIAPLLGRTVVLVAHPDDETGGCAALLQRMCDPIVVFATDGAPADKFFWSPFGSREAYSRLRRQEALRALSGLGIKSVHFLGDYCGVEFRDQELHRVLTAALSALEQLLKRRYPDAVLVPAYEGGHPDHDACSLLGWALGSLYGIPVWEMPLYHRSASGRIVCQRFLHSDGTELTIRCSATELFNRNALISAYASQSDLGEFVKSRVECFRPQCKYDYTSPPHDGPLNFEAWGWPISSADVCRSFQHFLASVETRQRLRENLVPVNRVLFSGDSDTEFEHSRGA